MSAVTSFDHFEKVLNRLVESFGKRLTELKQSGYAEAQLRSDFLDPFLAALGWDLTNRAGLIQAHREVVIELRIDSGRADYMFRTDRKPRFVCEGEGEPFAAFLEIPVTGLAGRSSTNQRA